MPVTDAITALAIVLLWLAGIVWCTVRYIQAWRAEKRVEKWLWFILWCVFVSFIEWVVYFAMGAMASLTHS